MRYSNRHKPYRLKLSDAYALGTLYRDLREYLRRYLHEYLKRYLRKSPYEGYKSSKPFRKTSDYDINRPEIRYRYQVPASPKEKYNPMPKEEKYKSFPIMPRERVYKTGNDRLLEILYNEKNLENAKTIKNLEEKISELEDLLKERLPKEESEPITLEKEAEISTNPMPTQEIESFDIEENLPMFEELEKQLYDLPEIELSSEDIPLEDVEEPVAELEPKTRMKDMDEPEVGAEIDGY